jgi:low affinity Fe/Cu permease
MKSGGNGTRGEGVGAGEPQCSAASLLLEKLAHAITDWTGGSMAFALAAGFVAVWALTGPWFHFSDTWQLVINTSTTVVTFLMVFLIQRSQNKDARAVHLKLNEIVAAMQGASNRLINVEDLNEAEVKALHERYRRLVEMTGADRSGRQRDPDAG